MLHRAFNVLGNIAIVNFSEDAKKSDKQSFAKKILKEQKNIKTVLEKSGNFSGRLRKMKTNFLAGENTKEVLYKENNCAFRFNVDTTYFSPRLSNERKEIASLIKKDENVLVMFAGVSPFSIVIAKNSKAKKIYSNELNREANKYGELNISLNKVKDKVELISGDIKKVAKKLNKDFDVIVMPRPNLKDTFLESAFNLSKRGTRIYYYGFCKIGEENKIIEQIKEEALKAKKKIKILKIKKAGEIAPYKIRLRVDIKLI
jgi:tRNA (guanine37-N1)-methyltransferase